MTEQYYCKKCKDYTLPHNGQFQHPDLGLKNALLCYKCGHMVFKKEYKEK